MAGRTAEDGGAGEGGSRGHEPGGSAGADEAGGAANASSAGADSGVNTCSCTPLSLGTVAVSLDCLCQSGCPDLASEQVPLPACDSYYERRGCGRVQFAFMNSYGEGRAYEYAATTGELTGAVRSSDEWWGACEAAMYVAGDYGDLSDCPDYVECLNCVTDVGNNPTPLCSTLK